MINHTVHEQIKDRINPLSAFIGESVPLKRSGRMMKGCCPFHKEKTPSFYVNDDTGKWVCYGACSDHGDVFDFVERKFGMSHREAVEMLASRLNIELTEVETEDKPYSKAIAEYIMAYCTTEDDRFRSFVAERGLTQETSERFRLSLSANRLPVCEIYYPELLGEMGLIRPDTTNMHLNRLVIPIRSINGDYVAIATREITGLSAPGLPKYMNTHETPVFHKRSMLYGLQPGLINRNGGVLILVEGYFDVMQMAQSGFPAAAYMAGSLLPDQIDLASRYAKRMVLMGDGDDAGMKSHHNIGWYAIEKTKPLYVSRLPDGCDPDDIARMGDHAVRSALNAAIRIDLMVMRELAATAENTVQKREIITRFAAACYGSGSDRIAEISRMLTAELQMPASVVYEIISSYNPNRVRRVSTNDVRIVPIGNMARHLFNQYGITVPVDPIIDTATNYSHIYTEEILARYCLIFITNMAYTGSCSLEDVEAARRALQELDDKKLLDQSEKQQEIISHAV